MNEVNGTEVDMELEPEGGLMPEQDEVSRPAVVDTKAMWTCAECTTVNGSGTDHCAECGAERIVIPESLQELGVTEKGIKALANGLVDHAANAAGAEQVENPNRKPEDVPLPLDTATDNGESFERFNANKAMSSIIAKNIEVQASRDKYDSLKKQAADAKKELDQDEAALGRIISQFARAREVQNSPQAMLPLNGQPAAIDSACPWERAHPGQQCPVCFKAKEHKLDPDVNSEVHPEHAGHEQVANDAHDHAVLKPLIPKLEAKGWFHVDLLDLQTLDGDQLQSLLDWVDQNGIVPPAILATAHVAAEAGTIAQVCKNCDALLASTYDAEGFYPEGALIGFDCDAKLNEVVEAAEAVEQPAAEEAPVEAARTPKSHAKKDGKKKREPEKERVEQVEAGKKKAAPKAKAKKGSKK